MLSGAVWVLGALVIVTVEALVPTFGLLGLLAACCYGYGVWLGFCEGPAQGVALLVMGAAGAPCMFLFAFRVIGPRMGIISHSTLPPPQAAPVEREALHVAEGAEGVSESVLRPRGTARFGDRRLEVVSESGVIPAQTPVCVVRIEGARIVVRMTTQRP